MKTTLRSFLSTFTIGVRYKIKVCDSHKKICTAIDSYCFRIHYINTLHLYGALNSDDTKSIVILHTWIVTMSICFSLCHESSVRHFVIWSCRAPTRSHNNASKCSDETRPLQCCGTPPFAGKKHLCVKHFKRIYS
jgi:hypothetical protein